MGTYSETEEDSFFDIRTRDRPSSDLGPDGSDACTRNEISERALGYEFWTQDPESVDERRHRFCGNVMSTSNCDRPDFSDERKMSTDRIRDDNETVLANSDAEESGQRSEFVAAELGQDGMSGADYVKVWYSKSSGPKTSKKESKELAYTGQEFLAHEGSIITMKFSPCGQYLASAGKDGTVRIWRVIEDDV
ncbi:hypothetical protein HAX54_048700 [Datura stramonium]|uniref:Uncharacterized protein n=1 Tax=Datura stramonium TaxID=4076 RepID=A0ABS8SU18_DATST|nr:hypothetical protein [Datura stramonium]